MHVSLWAWRVLVGRDCGAALYDYPEAVYTLDADTGAYEYSHTKPARGMAWQ